MTAPAASPSAGRALLRDALAAPRVPLDGFFDDATQYLWVIWSGAHSAGKKLAIPGSVAAARDFVRARRNHTLVALRRDVTRYAGEEDILALAARVSGGGGSTRLLAGGGGKGAPHSPPLTTREGGPPVFLNLHKRCEQEEGRQPLETVRLSQLLRVDWLII